MEMGSGRSTDRQESSAALFSGVTLAHPPSIRSRAMSSGLPDRAASRLAWTREALADPGLTLEPASADASFRSYWRTRHAGQSWIVMDSPPALEDPAPWLAIGTRLAAAGLHVPTVRAQDLQQGFLLIEDLGSQLYLP